MRNILLFFTFFLVYTTLMLSSLSASPASCTSTIPNAQGFLSACAGGTVGIQVPTDESKKSVQDRVKLIAEKAIGLGAIFAIAFLVWAGIQYTTAYGDDEKLKHAKSTGIYALGGLLLLMLAFGLVDIVLRFIYDFS